MRVQIENQCFEVTDVEYRDKVLFLVPVDEKIEIHIVGSPEKVKELFDFIVRNGFLTDDMFYGMDIEEVEI